MRILLAFIALLVGSVAAGLLATTLDTSISPSEASGNAIPASGLEFSISIDVDGDGTIDCDSSSGPATCMLTSLVPFTVGLRLLSLPDKLTDDDYQGYDWVLSYAGGVVSKLIVDPEPWPECELASSQFGPGSIAIACAAFPSPSTYTGLLATAEFNCEASGSISMLHGVGNTGLTDVIGSFFAESETAAESLNVVCEQSPAQTATPPESPAVTPTEPGPGTMTPTDSAPTESAPGTITPTESAEKTETATPIATTAMPPEPAPGTTTPTESIKATLTASPTASGPQSVRGDANCDRSVNSIDAALILQLSAALLDEIACESSADASENGVIDAVDAALVLQFVAGLLIW